MLVFLDIVVLSVAGLIALALVLLFRLLTMPRNPLTDLLVGLAKRTALTSGVAVIDPPSLAVPLIGFLFVAGTLALTGYYWWTFLRDDVRRFADSRAVAVSKR
jgi:amino acid transporter